MTNSAVILDTLATNGAHPDAIFAVYAVEVLTPRCGRWAARRFAARRGPQVRRLMRLAEQLHAMETPLRPVR